MRILFLGTPEFAVPTLKELIADPRFDVVGVVSQPDRPAGRGNKVQATPTKAIALENKIPVFQPISLSKSPETVEQLQQLAPDYIVMVAFGQILRKVMLDLPKLGVVNIHGSLLPKYRGAAPINWAIINGETVTGITTMFSEAGVDTGPMLMKSEVAIGPNMTAPDLAAEMSGVGARLLIDTLIGLSSGAVQPELQNEAEYSLAPMLTKEMGKIDWSVPAHTIHNLVRGLQPWPGTFTAYKEAVLKVTKTLPQDQQQELKPPGTVLSDGNRITVACGIEGGERIELLEVQPANKSRMSGRDWVNGVHLQPGEVLRSI